MITRFHKPAKPYKQRIHLIDGVWTYRINPGLVIIREPSLMITHEIHVVEFTSFVLGGEGLTPDQIENGIHKGWWYGIRPGQIRDFILQKIGNSGKEFMEYCLNERKSRTFVPKKKSDPHRRRLDLDFRHG